MAIDHQSISGDLQYDLMRNAPTPKMNEEFNEGSMFEPLGSFGSDSMPFGAEADAQSLVAMLQNNQTIVFPQGTGANGGSSVQMYSDAMPGAMSASPAQFNLVHSGGYGSSAFGASTQTFSNMSQFAGSPYAVSGRESVASQLSTRDEKTKCMSRNAIAARENRDKKKKEAISMKNRVKFLEEENALLKKKYHEVKEAYHADHERLKYYDALMSNITSIGSVVPIIEHLKNLPERTTAKINEQIKEKFSIDQNLAICCVIGENKEMTLRFCETCSAGSSSTKKKKAVDT
ncbi:hypothetical protein TYRP_018798 [Tyrophagus putrescentiae]|nr:hypothetical protein TYRP_018798 [Tyrophagus putrescentiae]